MLPIFWWSSQPFCFSILCYIDSSLLIWLKLKNSNTLKGNGYVIEKKSLQAAEQMKTTFPTAIVVQGEVSHHHCVEL